MEVLTETIDSNMFTGRTGDLTYSSYIITVRRNPKHNTHRILSFVGKMISSKLKIVK